MKKASRSHNPIPRIFLWTAKELYRGVEQVKGPGLPRESAMVREKL
jgi:hypothetical protein